MEFLEGDDGPIGWMAAGLFLAYPVVGLLALFGLLAPLGGWIEQQQGWLGMLGPASLVGLVAVRFLSGRARWLLWLPCSWCVACWLAPFLGRFVGSEDRQAIIGMVAIVAMGMQLPVLVDWQDSTAADPVASRDGGAS